MPFFLTLSLKSLRLSPINDKESLTGAVVAAAAAAAAGEFVLLGGVKLSICRVASVAGASVPALRFFLHGITRRRRVQGRVLANAGFSSGSGRRAGAD